jgi:Mg-chelatase subunit ChlD
MNRMFEFLDKKLSAFDKLLDERITNQLETKRTTSAVRSDSKITSFTEQPRDTVQILDISSSMGERDYVPTRLAGGIRAAIEYVNNRAAQCPEDRIAIVSFNEYAHIVIHLTSVAEKKEIIGAIKKLKASGSTDIAEGLQAAICIFDEDSMSDHLRHINLLTDGHGGNPIRKASKLKKQYGAVINVIGIGGVRKAVKESLLRKTATTDPDGFNHYCFIKDSATLKHHYCQLATGIVWQGKEK